MKRKFIIFIIFILALMQLVACKSSDNRNHDYTVAVLLPCDTNSKWVEAANGIQEILNDKNCKTLIYFADKKPTLQKEQILNAIDSNVDAIIISAVDADDLAPTLDLAAENNIKIIAYDTLPKNTDAVSYYAAYDNYLVGVQQALSLIEGMQSKGEGVYNIEIFITSTANNNVQLYYEGAMSILNPLIENGEINVISQVISYADIECISYDVASSAIRFSNLLETYYSDGTVLHGILSPSDKLSLEIIDVLKSQGFEPPYPIITGQNANIENIKAIAQSEQYSTIYKDSSQLVQIVCSMVIALLNDEIPEINDTTSFDNGVKIVPAFLCEPILITRQNYESILTDTGYYKYEDIFPE